MYTSRQTCTFSFNLSRQGNQTLTQYKVQVLHLDNGKMGVLLVFIYLYILLKCISTLICLKKI